ncbi:MAG: hypothetical protein PHQ90_05575 [Sulfuricurvum sp.]|nr:hypothetical protein [Sulfuricurvum sp.]
MNILIITSNPYIECQGPLCHYEDVLLQNLGRELKLKNLVSRRSVCVVEGHEIFHFEGRFKRSVVLMYPGHPQNNDAPYESQAYISIRNGTSDEQRELLIHFSEILQSVGFECQVFELLS